MALNSVTIVGRLVKDPETRAVGTDMKVCSFTLAVDKKKKDAGANFINCKAWNGLAETIEKYVHKGDQFGVSGYLDQQTWEKDGQKHSALDVVVNDIVFIGGKKDSGANEAPAQPDIDSIVPF